MIVTYINIMYFDQIYFTYITLSYLPSLLPLYFKFLVGFIMLFSYIDIVT
jgi:hypothetical protein